MVTKAIHLGNVWTIESCSGFGLPLMPNGRHKKANMLMVTQLGLVGLDIGSSTLTVPQSSPVRPLKRSYHEIADSEDDDPGSDAEYGWENEDALAAEGLVSDALVDNDATLNRVPGDHS